MVLDGDLYVSELAGGIAQLARASDRTDLSASVMTLPNIRPSQPQLLHG
jgi:hypothetical protein